MMSISRQSISSIISLLNEKDDRSVEQLPDEEASRILELPVPQEEISVTEELAMEPSVDGQCEEGVPF